MRTTMGVGAAALLCGQALGAVSGTGGMAVSIAPPATTALDANESNTQARVFVEAQSHTLAAGLPADITVAGLYDAPGDLTPGVIAPGTVVNSHYLWTDPVGDAVQVYEGFVEFDQPALGIIVLRAGLNGTDVLLGNPLTLYADNAARGLELSTNADRVALSVSLFRVTFRFTTSGATDDIRVITAVPGVPAGAALVAAGGWALARRRRR